MTIKNILNLALPFVLAVYTIVYASENTDISPYWGATLMLLICFFALWFLAVAISIREKE
jgi:hypothetical protein